MAIPTITDRACGDVVARLLLAHGAGAPMDSPFMEQIARLLADQHIDVVRFEFPYMAERRATGKKRPPNRQPELLDTWRMVFSQQQAATVPTYIGGKSMGGRMAAIIANELACAGVVCLGFPFYPAGKPEKNRVETLQQIKKPTLVIQGERDSLGNKETVSQYKLAKSVAVSWLADADHDLKPRKRSGHSHEEHLIRTADWIAEFVGEGS
ncbi:alpha/beta family hydrolase [Aurantivibrio plasticivorans]